MVQPQKLKFVSRKNLTTKNLHPKISFHVVWPLQFHFYSLMKKTIMSLYCQPLSQVMVYEIVTVPYREIHLEGLETHRTEQLDVTPPSIIWWIEHLLLVDYLCKPWQMADLPILKDTNPLFMAQSLSSLRITRLTVVIISMPSLRPSLNDEILSTHVNSFTL